MYSLSVYDNGNTITSKNRKEYMHPLFSDVISENKEIVKKWQVIP